MKAKKFILGLLFGCVLASVFFLFVLPRVLHLWQAHAKSGGSNKVSSRTPIQVQTLEGFVFVLNGGFVGDVKEVIVRQDGPSATLCIAVCVQDNGPSLEHQFIITDLQFKRRETNGDLVFIRTRKDFVMMR